VKWLAVTLACLLSGTVMANEAQELVLPETSEWLPLTASCSFTDQGPMLEERHGEIALVGGRMVVVIPDEKRLPGRLRFYINTETGSYTIVFVVEGQRNIHCIIASGLELEPLKYKSTLNILKKKLKGTLT